MTIVLWIIDGVTWILDILGIISFVNRTINHFKPSTSRRQTNSNNERDLPSLPQVLNYNDVKRVYLTGVKIYNPGTNENSNQEEKYQAFFNCIEIGDIIEVSEIYVPPFKGRVGAIITGQTISIENIYEGNYHFHRTFIKMFKFIKESGNKTQIEGYRHFSSYDGYT